MAGALIGAVPALLPYVGAVVSAVEHLFAHKPGSGAQKKQAAMSMLQAGLGVLGTLEQTPGTPVTGSNLEQDLSRAIDDVVAIMNDVGAFRHQLKVVK